MFKIRHRGTKTIWNIVIVVSTKSLQELVHDECCIKEWIKGVYVCYDKISTTWFDVDVMMEKEEIMNELTKNIEWLIEQADDEKTKDELNSILNRLEMIEKKIAEKWKKTEEEEKAEFIEIVKNIFGSNTKIEQNSGFIFVNNWDVFREGLLKVLEESELFTSTIEENNKTIHVNIIVQHKKTDTKWSIVIGIDKNGKDCMEGLVRLLEGGAWSLGWWIRRVIVYKSSNVVSWREFDILVKE